MTVLYIALGLLGCIILSVIIRTMRFKPKHFPEMVKKNSFDEQHAIESLSQMLTFKTISYSDPKKENQKTFKDFRAFIKDRYPITIEHATYLEIERGMLFHIKGENADQPIVLMSHYDVVPINGIWKEDPFSGRINETSVYGRGALDTKSSLNAIMEACEYVLSQGKTFKQDLYLAFGGDEEVFGKSAKAIVDYFKEKGIVPYMVLDEGGAIVKDAFPGVREKTAVVGIAEKGFLNIKLTSKSFGGHASTPPKDTPLTDLAKAITKLNKTKKFKLEMTMPVRALFDTLAPHSKSLAIKVLFANLWLFQGVVKLIAKNARGEFLAMFKTTQAFTLAEGSEAVNVLPSSASMGINYRLRPGDTSTDVIKTIKKVIKNPSIEVEAVEVNEASTISLMDDGFKILTKAINQTRPDVIVSPYLMVATTDSRHYHAICDRVYKFSPMDVTRDDLKKIHGVDEDISIENIKLGVQFYINLLDLL